MAGGRLWEQFKDGGGSTSCGEIKGVVLRGLSKNDTDGFAKLSSG